MALGVERDDLELELLALVDDVGRMGDALMGQLADVDQALEAVAHADERPEVDELGDGAIDDVADLEVRDGRMPRIGLQPTDRQADPAALVVDVDDLGLDLLADLVAGFGVVDLVPAQFALVDEAVDATEVDEHAERRDRADGALDRLADLQAAEQLVPLLAALLVEGDLLREDEPVGLAIDLEDLEPQLAADERLELLGDLLGRVARLVVLRPAREVDDLADRHEAADAAIDDEAALVVVDDRRLDDDARLELLLHRAPLALESGAAERQDDVALGRLRLEDVDEDGVTDVELGWPSPWRPNSSRLLTTPSLLAPMSTRISSLSIRTTVPSTTSPCLKLLMSVSCSASSSSIVVGSGPSSRDGLGLLLLGGGRGVRRLVVAERAVSARRRSAPRARARLRRGLGRAALGGGRLGRGACGGPRPRHAGATTASAARGPRRLPRRASGSLGTSGVGGLGRGLGGRPRRGVRCWVSGRFGGVR